MQVEMAWRDERVNVFALSGMTAGLEVEPQLFVCKKRPVAPHGLFALDPARGRARYQLSPLGGLLQERVARTDYPLVYVAEVDGYLRIPVAYAVFSGLCAEGWFTLWNPSAPLAYFEDRQEGYLALMKISVMDTAVPEQLLLRGRSGSNFVYYLDQPVVAGKLRPLLRPQVYARRTGELRAYLDEHGWLLGEELPASVPESEPESLFNDL